MVPCRCFDCDLRLYELPSLRDKFRIVTPYAVLRRLAPLAVAAAASLSCGRSNPPTGGNVSQFTLELIWLGTQPAGGTLASFDAAFSTVRSTIVGALSTVAIPENFTNLSQCGLSGHPDIARDNIRGLRVYLLVDSIDGPAGTLGQAGPCLVRANDIPALGYIRFDEADVATLQGTGRLTRVVLHEMMHVLGFGTVWYDNFVDTLSTPSDVRYTGPRARSACVNVHAGGAQCETSIPIHSSDGAGSRFSHWRESVFQTELMTPFLGSGATPFAEMSIQALADLGYEVSVTEADPYTVPASALAFLRDGSSAPDIVMPEPVMPRWRLDGAGRLTPYRDPKVLR